MENPYVGLPDQSFWRKAVSYKKPTEVDPMFGVPFKIGVADKVATAGSCFAQHISRTLVEQGFHYLVTEVDVSVSQLQVDHGAFSARFGNVYTTSQLLQLFQRAYGLFDPSDAVWSAKDGSFIDPFRPRIEHRGFHSAIAVIDDREKHLTAVRQMFEECNVFIFTLGVTESWRRKCDGAVFPLAPGVIADSLNPDLYEFHNFELEEVEEDLMKFLALFRLVNPLVKIILTVSPVSLIATYEARHVLQSTVYSKSVLRVVADRICRKCSNVAYFPSYEVISGPHARGAFYQDDFREVRPEAVSHVMGLFSAHFLSTAGQHSDGSERTNLNQDPCDADRDHERARLRALASIICDEEVLDSV